MMASGRLNADVAKGVKAKGKEGADVAVWAMDSAISNPFTLMALGGASFFFYREAAKKNAVLFSPSLNPFSVYFHAATCVAASFGMVVLEFVYGNFAVPLGLFKLITPNFATP